LKKERAMFDESKRNIPETPKRSAGCTEKLERMNKTLRHEEADRVPISDFF